MGFGKDSSFVFFMQDGKLVNIGRSDSTADKQPFDDVEEEVWRIFGEWKDLKASRDKLKDELQRLQAVVGEEDYKSIEQTMKEAEL